MNTKDVCMLSLLVILLVPLPQVNAQNSQGLYWGVEEESRFDFHLYSLFPVFNPESTISLYEENEFDFYITVNTVPEIPDSNPYFFYTLPNYALSYYFSNDTPLSQSTTGLIVPIIFPVGNWTLFSEYILEIGAENIELIDDAIQWGFRQTIEIGEQDSSLWNKIENEYIVSKSDGVMNTYSTIMTDLIIGEVTSSYQVTRITFPVMPIAFGAMIALEVVIAVVIYKKFKGRERKPVERKVEVNLDDLFNDL